MKVNRVLLLIIIYIIPGVLFSQKVAISVNAGLNYKVTPIYLKQIPFVIIASARNVLEEPDTHLSGAGLNYGASISKSKINIDIDHSFRKDMLYKEIPIDFVQPQVIPVLSIKRKVLHDININAQRIFRLRKSSVLTGVGIGIHNLNSGFILKQKVQQNGLPVIIESKENFTYYPVNANIGWQKNWFFSALRVYYITNNPTFFKTDFFLLELQVQYRFKLKMAK